MFKHKICHGELSKTHDKNINITAWKVSKYEVFSGPYLSIFSPNTGKYGPEKTRYLDTFYAVHIWWHVYEYEYFIIIIECTLRMSQLELRRRKLNYDAANSFTNS